MPGTVPVCTVKIYVHLIMCKTGAVRLLMTIMMIDDDIRKTQAVPTGPSQRVVLSPTVMSSPSVERKSPTISSSTKTVSTTPAGQYNTSVLSS